MIQTSINIIKRIFRFAYKEAAVFLIGTLISAAVAPMLILVNEQIINSAIDFISSKALYISIFNWVILFALLQIVSHCIIYFNERNSQKLRKRLYGEYSDLLIKKYLSLDFSFFENSKARDIINHVGNAPQELLLEYFKTVIGIISKIFTALGFLIIFFSQSFVFGVLGIISFCALIYFNNKRVKLMAELYDEQTPEERKLNYYNTILGDKRTLLDLRINNAVKSIKNKRVKIISEILQERIKRTVKSQMVYSIGTSCMVVWIGVVIFFVINQAMKGSISYGLVVALLGATQSIYTCFDGLSNDFAELSKSKVKVGYLERFLDLPEKDEKAALDMTLSSPITITFDNVSFRYPDTDKDVLRNVSFSVRSDQKYALVGENGSGKTTIIKLTCGFYKPTSGRILINGIPADNFSQKDLSKIFSVAFQDYCKYYFTLRENIALGNIDYINNDERIARALDYGQASYLKNQLDQPVGNIEENGIDLSEGQWQKIALSRACLKDSALLILDEPTASMDPVSENELYKEFMSLMKHRGCIIISHRLALAKQTDMILVLKDGQIVQTGNHESLYNDNGLYRTMFIAQSHWYNDKEMSNNE